MSEVKVNKISPRTNCGTVQLGDSGDTITIPAGATITNNGTQTGFGRTGTVDWQTGSIKTATFTAVSGEGYFCNTAGGAFELDLPAGSAGAIVSLQDYNNTFDTNALTVDPNGSEKINGGAAGEGLILETEGLGITFVYIDSTVGWKSVQSNEFTTPGLDPTYITATGGTITTDGNFKVHTFTGPGTFTVCSVGDPTGSNEVSYMVVAGGGAGGRGASGSSNAGAGGGAGGFREGKTPQCTYTASPLVCTSGSNNGIPVTTQGYPIVIGAGGSAPPWPANFPTLTPAASGNGSPSSGLGITSTAGGGGASRTQPSEFSGAPGGSGGGSHPGGSGGVGNTPPVSPSQGNPGGIQNAPVATASSAGGGGATTAGANFTSPTPSTKGTDGGAGATTSINGTPTAFAGGGGGGSGGCVPNPAQAGAGGTGGGGTGSGNNQGNNTAGTTNTGGGGGGGGGQNPGSAGQNGGSGIVIIRYKFQ
tara:strand:+ start:857 stop:2287 length:1431 start_codon:yes stop_codon:yes gene_type:complete